MLIDLVQVDTRDGVRLEGAYQEPLSAERQAPLDAVCLVHGTGSNFYSSTLMEFLAKCFRELGCAALRINTRGHDGISTAATTQGGRRAGAAFEVVDDCRHDLAVWIAWLKQRAGPRVGLIGHSLGAVKCLYALAHEPQQDARSVIAISPPRLSYSQFCQGPKADLFLQTYQAARALVDQGKGSAMLDVQMPLPMLITAAGYSEKYGPDERYNYLSFLRSVACPTLVTLGSLEMADNVAFQGAAADIAAAVRTRPNLTVATIEGADHFYGAARALLADRIREWLMSIG